jgi:hypothetical protein
MSDDRGEVLTIEINRGKPEDNIVGKRLTNPLSSLLSYTHQLSLYMITPEAHTAFVGSGRTNPNVLIGADGRPKGTYLIAQSGGINTTTNNRGSVLGTNYFIDNLSIKTFLSGSSTGTSATSTEVKFQIIEPYGFSFLSDMRKVSDIIYSDNTDPRPINPTRQHFLLGIKFIGYDENGNVLTSQGSDSKQIDADSDLYRIKDRYYDILITGIKFKIDGSATTYNIEGVITTSGIAFGAKKGIINHTVSIEGATVEDAVNDIITRLNKDQEAAEEQLEEGIRLDRYKVKFIGDEIAKSSILSPTREEDDDTISSLPGSGATETDSAGNSETPSVNFSETTKQIKDGTPVLQALNQIIIQSNYITTRLNKAFPSRLQPGDEGYAERAEKTDGITWFNIRAELENPVWNPILNDFSYEITYIIQPYETPIITAPYGISESTYYGPYKRYDYWYTGKNSEIISYEQTLDNAYYTVFLGAGTENMDDGITGQGIAEVSAVPNQQVNQSRLDTLNAGSTAYNTIVNNIYDPASFARAKITILGDPDYLMFESVSESSNKFYANDGFTINPNNGQIFIEIDFKEVRDLDDEEGIFKINDKLIFWRYPRDSEAESSKIIGISYQVIEVFSEFRGAIFKQTLNCIINPMSFSTPTKASRNPQRETASATRFSSRDNLITSLVPQINNVSNNTSNDLFISPLRSNINTTSNDDA